jgi:hypothetical protein
MSSRPVGLPRQPDRPGNRSCRSAIYHHLTHHHSLLPNGLLS